MVNPILGSQRVKLSACLIVCSVALGCTSAIKKTTPEISKLEGKKVALVEVQGEATEKAIVEVALINQLMEQGSFELVAKRDVEEAQRAHEQDTTDLLGVARRAGADYALQAKVVEFDATTAEGYSTEEVEDSQLEAERGKGNGKTERLFKAKSMHGKIKVELKFTSLSDGEVRTAIAEAEEKITAEAKAQAIHLPPKMRFLEKLTNAAFKQFFVKYR